MYEKHLYVQCNQVIGGPRALLAPYGLEMCYKRVVLQQNSTLELLTQTIS